MVVLLFQALCYRTLSTVSSPGDLCYNTHTLAAEEMQNNHLGVYKQPREPRCLCD